MLTVTATYKNLHYEATELDGDRVAVHGPTSTCWTAWRRGRLVRSQPLAATAPKRVISRLEERLRRARQLGAVPQEPEGRQLPNYESQMARNARAQQRLLEAREWAVTSAEDQRGWAAWARFLQLPETASHEEILAAIGHPPDLELPRAGMLVIPVAEGERSSVPRVPDPLEVTEIQRLTDVLNADISRMNRERGLQAHLADLAGLPESASHESASHEEIGRRALNAPHRVQIYEPWPITAPPESRWAAARAAGHYPGCPVARGQTEPCVGSAGRMPSACRCGFGTRLAAAARADREQPPGHVERPEVTRRSFTDWARSVGMPEAEIRVNARASAMEPWIRPELGVSWDAAGATPLADLQAGIQRIRENTGYDPTASVDLPSWARMMGLPETASREDILERLARPGPDVRSVAARQRLEALADEIRNDMDYGPVEWVRLRGELPITQGSPAYMQSLVAQITPETAQLWADAWGCAPAALAARVLEPGPGDLVDSDTARELSRRILADVGQAAVDGARRADRSVYDRHNDPDTAEDLEYYDGTPEPLEDVEWLRGVLAETTKEG